MAWDFPTPARPEPAPRGGGQGGAEKKYLAADFCLAHTPQSDV